jgi:hypothetical protein
MVLLLLILTHVLVGIVCLLEYHYRAFAGDCGIEDNGGYIDATESQWLENYQMFSYVNDEFYELIVQNFNVDIHRIGIFG